HARARPLPPRPRRRSAGGHRARHRARLREPDPLPLRPGAMSEQTIDTMLLEERRYPPPPEFAAQANAQPDIYDRDFDEFWETEAWGGGSPVPLKQRADDAMADAPNGKTCVVLRRTGGDVPMQDGRDHWWHDVVEGAADECPPEPMDSEDLLFLMYTSGTTAK